MKSQLSRGPNFITSNAHTFPIPKFHMSEVIDYGNLKLKIFKLSEMPISDTSNIKTFENSEIRNIHTHKVF